jgi:uncharacterized MnhB-related membrane protein
MTLVTALAMAAVAIFGTAVVFVRDPLRQLVALGPFGVSLVILIAVLQAPDVVLSAIVVGVFAYPVMLAITLSKLRSTKR